MNRKLVPGRHVKYIAYYIHCNATITVLCSFLLTCGSDGDVRIYKDFDDSDPESVRAGDNVTVLVVKVRMLSSVLETQWSNG